jgi:1-acyl-sn-glycerol-3-phosphate acyltransferase
MNATLAPRSDLPRRHSPPGFHRLAKGVSRLVIACLTRLDVQGLKNLPSSGFVGVTNHLSSFDPMLILATMPVRPVAMFAAIEHRRDFIVGWALERLGAIWIDRDDPSREALRIALNEIAWGAAFGIAPEGTRSKTGGLQAGKTGAVYLATRAQVPILTTVVWGTEQIARNLRRFRRTLVHLHIDAPIHLPPGRADAAKLQEYTDMIMRRMAAMLPPEYRGVYADAFK